MSCRNFDNHVRSCLGQPPLETSQGTPAEESRGEAGGEDPDGSGSTAHPFFGRPAGRRRRPAPRVELPRGAWAAALRAEALLQAEAHAEAAVQAASARPGARSSARPGGGGGGGAGAAAALEAPWGGPTTNPGDRSRVVLTSLRHFKTLAGAPADDGPTRLFDGGRGPGALKGRGTALCIMAEQLGWRRPVTSL